MLSIPAENAVERVVAAANAPVGTSSLTKPKSARSVSFATVVVAAYIVVAVVALAARPPFA